MSKRCSDSEDDTPPPKKRYNIKLKFKENENEKEKEKEKENENEEGEKGENNENGDGDEEEDDDEDALFQYFLKPPPELVIIKKEVHTIADLIEIGKMYDPTKIYNIDVKILHDLVEPLTTLDTMIGMTAIKQEMVDHILFACRILTFATK
jgi:hypothetical protein